ncbi:hypothetical protein HK098_004513 [Nowakowskiella sp. JEL0407]|nr:hypothetical protein HK098_004513 [Nowakowskiella sp. JEL0407]
MSNPLFPPSNNAPSDLPNFSDDRLYDDSNTAKSASAKKMNPEEIGVGESNITLYGTSLPSSSDLLKSSKKPETGNINTAFATPAPQSNNINNNYIDADNANNEENPRILQKGSRNIGSKVNFFFPDQTQISSRIQSQRSQQNLPATKTFVRKLSVSIPDAKLYSQDRSMSHGRSLTADLTQFGTISSEKSLSLSAPRTSSSTSSDVKNNHFRTISARVRGSYANCPSLYISNSSSVDSLQFYEEKQRTTTRISNVSIFKKGSQDDMFLGIGKHFRVDVLTERPGSPSISSNSKRVGWQNEDRSSPSRNPVSQTKEKKLSNLKKELQSEGGSIEGQESSDEELKFQRPITQASKRTIFLSVDKSDVSSSKHRKTDRKSSLKRNSDMNALFPATPDVSPKLECRLNVADEIHEETKLYSDDDSKKSPTTTPVRRRSSFVESLQAGRAKAMWLLHHIPPPVPPKNWVSLRNAIALANMFIAGVALALVTYLGYFFRRGYIEGMSMLVARLVLIKSLVSVNETLFALEHHNAGILNSLKFASYDISQPVFNGSILTTPCKYLLDTVTESVVFSSFLNNYTAALQTNTFSCTAERVGFSRFTIDVDYYQPDYTNTWVCDVANQLLSTPSCTTVGQKTITSAENYTFSLEQMNYSEAEISVQMQSYDHFLLDTGVIPTTINFVYRIPSANTSIITSYPFDSIPYPKRRDDLTFKSVIIDTNGKILARKNITSRLDLWKIQDDNWVRLNVRDLTEPQYFEIYMIFKTYGNQTGDLPDAKVWSDTSAYLGRKYFVAPNVPVVCVVQVDYEDVQREVFGNMFKLSSLELLNHYEWVSPLFSVSTMIVATILSFLITRKMGKPIKDVAERLRKIADLNFEEEEPLSQTKRWWNYLSRSSRDLDMNDSRATLDSNNNENRVLKRYMPRYHEMQRIDAAIVALKSGLLSFSKYVPLDVVSLLVKLKREAVLGVDEMELTIFFSDIANFTSISEIMLPKDLVIMMSEYLDQMSNIIGESQGIVDKFIGDAIMAFWNAPLFLPDHASIACKAALKSQRRLFDLRKDWSKRGYPEIFSRIGVHTGQTLVGNIGSQSRLSYTCLGDTVNTASRLEGLNKRYGTSILISEATYNYAKSSYLCRPLDVVTVKGKKVAIKIYELLGVRKDTENSRRMSAKVELYEECFGAYCRKDFGYGLHVLERYHKRYGGDVASRMLKDKMEILVNDGIPDNWTNVTVIDEK